MLILFLSAYWRYFRYFPVSTLPYQQYSFPIGSIPLSVVFPPYRQYPPPIGSIPSLSAIFLIRYFPR